MLTSPRLLAALFLAPALLAQEADLEVTSVVLDKTTVTMGEPFSYTVRVRNNGPAAARNAVIHMNAHSGAFPLSMTAPEGWTCRRSLSSTPGAKCTLASFAGNDEAVFRGTALAPRDTAAWAMTLFAVATSDNDSKRENNEQSTRFSLNVSPVLADLGVTVEPRGGARENTRALVDVVVTNDGPGSANNVTVAIDTRGEGVVLDDVLGAGTGWTCTSSMLGLLCRTAGLPASAAGTIEVSFLAPNHEADIDVAANVQAEGSRDTNFRNDTGAGNVGVGSPENYRRILLPLARDYTPGANGAEWRTRTTLLIRSSEHVDIWPGPCDRIVDPCIPMEREVAVDAGPLIYTEGPGGQFLYVRPADEAKLSLSTRIWDEARFTETAGAEIPAVRENELKSSTISLIGIPVAPQYRHTLRVYDADARSSAAVRIHVFGPNEKTPRLSVVRTLQRSDETFLVTSARLPSHPGYAEIRLADLLPLEGLQELRVDIEPLDGLRFWAFVSITNNETHHVTTITQQ